MLEMLQNGDMSQRHSLLQAGSSRRMLDEGQRLGRIAGIGQLHLEAGAWLRCGSQQLRLFAETDMAKQIVGKLIVDHNRFGLEISCHSRQSETVFRRFNLEVRVGENCGNRAQQHRAGKRRHQGNSLRHDQDDAVAHSNSVARGGAGPALAPAGGTRRR